MDGLAAGAALGPGGRHVTLEEGRKEVARELTEKMRAQIAPHWDAILEAVASNQKTVYQAGIDIAGASISSIQRYARQVPGAREQLDAALADGCELMMAQIDEMIKTEPDARRARVRADFQLKLAQSRDPKRWGERMRHDVTVKTLDLTRIISEANARLAGARAPLTIDHATGAALPAPAIPGLDEAARAALAALL